MNDREQRGLVIAAKCRIVCKGGVWSVPSQSGTGNYVVDLEPENQEGPRCTCPDHELTGGKCKHIFAVEIVSQREQYADGSSTVTKTVTIKEEVRKTYRQSWPDYNAAQTHEKERFLSLLQDLCRGIQAPPPAKTGRKPLPLADAIFGACYKVYSGFSARRFMTDMRGAVADGYCKSAMAYNSILKVTENADIAPILKSMIQESSRPLSTVELDFACDSTGFMTTRYERWFDYKYGKPKAKQEWVKLHFTTGVKTNVITAVVIKDKNAADTTQLPDMAKETRKTFKIREFSADMAYGSSANFEAIAATGGMGYIPFKSNATGGAGGLYEKMFHYFNFKRDEFLTHYHKRSNAESTVSMIKRKFGDSVRSKTDAAMVNETLMKVVCHNIVVLIHEMYELGIEPVFWSEKNCNELPIGAG
ncbi:MAG TPA: transposase [Gemmataceae bacterium]|nr:transposase [Gemmataceae bacterium]